MARFGFATVEDAAHPAKNSNFSGFPFPVPLVGAGVVGIGTQYPVGMSRAMAAYCYWKVRQWQVAISFSSWWGDPGNPYPNNETYFVDAGENGGSVATPSIETDLMQPPRETLDGSSPSTSNLAMFVNDAIGGTFAQAVESDGLIYPWMLIDVEVPDGPGTEWNSVPAGALNFLGLAPIQLYSDGATDWVGSITVSANTEWAYAP